MNASKVSGEGFVIDQAHNPLDDSEDPAADNAAPEQAEGAPREDAPVDPPAEGAAEEAAAPEPEAPEAEASEPEAAEEAAGEDEAPSDKSSNLQWYILKVASNREETIKQALLRRVAIEGLEYYFDEVIVPTEMVTEFKGGKKKVVKRKLYPGYILIHMEINDDTWFLVRETPGIGDFTGAAGKPVAMEQHEVERFLPKKEGEEEEDQPKLDIKFRPGDRVKVNEGNFENFEGEVDSIDTTNGRVTVMINIFNRTTPVELEYWQIESL